MYYLIHLLSALQAAELKPQWVESYSRPLHVQPLEGEGMAVSEEVVRFLAHWKQCLGAAQHVVDTEWILLPADENMDVLNTVAKDMYLHVRKMIITSQQQTVYMRGTQSCNKTKTI